MSTPRGPIPRFTVPDEYDHDRDRNYRAFRSPEDGEIVQILDDLWHASRIEDWMRADGERLTLAEFQEAALDPVTYPEYKGRPNGDDLRLTMAGSAFNAILNPIINTALKTGWGLVQQYPERYQANVFRPYASWTKDQFRRTQLLISTQAAFDTYTAYKNHATPSQRRLKFLRTLDVLFDAIPTEGDSPIEPDVFDENENEQI